MRLDEKMTTLIYEARHEINHAIERINTVRETVIPFPTEPPSEVLTKLAMSLSKIHAKLGGISDQYGTGDDGEKDTKE